MAAERAAMFYFYEIDESGWCVFNPIGWLMIDPVELL